MFEQDSVGQPLQSASGEQSSLSRRDDELYHLGSVVEMARELVGGVSRSSSSVYGYTIVDVSSSGTCQSPALFLAGAAAWGRVRMKSSERLRTYQIS